MITRRITRALWILASIVLLSLTGVVAESAAQDEETRESEVRKRVFRLGEIEVVGKEMESKNTTVEKVYDDEMRLFDRNDLADAVNLLPGVTLSQTGQRNEKTVYIRGFDIKHIPMFLDGIPIYVPYDGYPDLTRFSTFDLSEIVVSKGFTSVLYGPNTLGGAINMVSRRPVKEFEMNAGSGYSSGDTYHGFANFGSNQGKWYIQGGGSYLDSDHFSVSDGFTPTKVQGTGERVNSYRTDWKANIKIGLTPNESDEYALSYINQQGEKGSPPYTGYDPKTYPKWWQWPYWNKESIYFNSNTAILDKSYVKTRLYYDTFENSLSGFDDETYSTMLMRSSFKSYYEDYTYGGSIEAGTQLIPGNFVKLAFHYKDDVHREHNEGYPRQRFEDQIISIGIEDTIDITKRLYTIVGVSYDKVTNVEAQDLDSSAKALVDFPHGNTDAFNPQAGLFYKVTDSGTIHGSIAQKTRLPSLKDRYSYRFGTTLPNPDLQPESSVNYEFGYKDLVFNKITVEANAFYSNVSDFILFKTIADPDNPGSKINQNQNIGDIHQYGIELGASGYLLSCLKGGVNYTYIQYENRSSTDNITNIPHNKVFAYLQYFTPLKGLSLLGSVEYNGDRYSSTDGIRVAQEYALVNTKAIYEVYKGFSLEAGINNITDENYEIDEGYPLEGRTYFVNLRYKF
ncbi:MAG: TonB-dependent receptor [Syntrophobacter sp.]